MVLGAAAGFGALFLLLLASIGRTNEWNEQKKIRQKIQLSNQIEIENAFEKHTLKMSKLVASSSG